MAFASLTPTAAQARSAVPVPNGAYGYAERHDPDMILFKVRNRKIINPQFSITVNCEHNDGSESEVVVGPTTSDPGRRFRIPADGNRRVSWDVPTDPSLIPDGTASLGVTFQRNGRVLAMAEFEAQYEEFDPETGGIWTSTCYGARPFRLQRGPLRAN